MTAPCSLCHLNPAEPQRGVCADCRRSQRRLLAQANAKAHRASPAPMEWWEFEELQGAGEGKRKVVEL